MFTRLPPELWLQVFAHACIDDGHTGRSLSAVSHQVRDLANVSKFQSVSIFGFGQLDSFFSIIDKTPPAFRQVRYLFVSQHSSNLSPITLEVEYNVRTVFWNTLARLLECLAPSLEIMHLTIFFRRPFLLLPVSMPALIELSLFEADSTGDVVNDGNLPALRHLHITNVARETLTHVPSFPKALTHLRVSSSQPILVVPPLTGPTQPGFNILIDGPTEPSSNSSSSATIHQELVDRLTSMTAGYSTIKILVPKYVLVVSGETAQLAFLERLSGKRWWNGDTYPSTTHTEEHYN